MLQDNAMHVLVSILTQNQHGIATLNLSENCLRDSGIEIIAPALGRNTSIVHLNICQTLLTPYGFSKIFKALMQNESIAALEIGNPGNANRNRIGEEGTKSLIMLLQLNWQIQFLDMNGLTIGDDCCKLLLEGIKSNFTLAYLNLARNNLTGTCFTAFKHRLSTQEDGIRVTSEQKLSGLLELDLAGNNISGLAGMQALCSFLSDRRNNIAKLNLSNCRIGHKVADHLFGTVATKCPQLTTLNLKSNNFKQKAIDRLGYCIQQSRL
jgi:Ran GTPase-activating protein (RanGAP) involved in mRNA processing and transport